MSDTFNMSIKKIYGKKCVLDIENVSFEFGKKYAIIGTNGSGKSTLLKAIAKEIKYEGKTDLDPKKKITYMPQQSVGFSMSVLNNLKIVCVQKEVKQKEPEITALLRDLGLFHLRKKNANKLSGGETQRVSLARTLLVKSDVLLLDEFTASMDIEQSQKSQEVLKSRLNESNTTLIFTTHKMTQAENLADYIIFLYEGKVKEIIEAKNFMQNAKTEVLKQFLEYMLNYQR